MSSDFVKVRCTQCEKSLKVPSRLLGSRASCPGCGQTTELSVSETLNSVVVADRGERRIGRYLLLSRIGHGGFGDVWRAKDEHLDRPVAMKLPRFGPNDAKRLKRFLAESQAAARLAHPNIVTLYDADEVDGQPYLAIELLEGESLQAVADRAPIPNSIAVSIVMQLADALHYAHQSSIVHRDIKPQNIVMDSKGLPKIVDFGLAKMLDEHSGQTVDGTVMGTPSYMAPEQARGAIQEMGPHTDQYSLGVVLYWMLTRRVPFSGPHAIVLNQVIHSAPERPSAIVPDLDPRLEAICLKAMSKAPSDRYANCAEMAEDLRRFSRDEDVLAKPASMFARAYRWSQSYPLQATLAVSAVSLVLLGIVVASIGLWRTRQLAIDANDLKLKAEQEYKNQLELETEMEKQLLIATESKERAEKAELVASTKKKELEATNNELASTLAKNRQLAMALTQSQKVLRETEKVTEVLSSKLEQLDNKKAEVDKLQEAVQESKPETLDAQYAKVGGFINSDQWQDARKALDRMTNEFGQPRWRLLSHITNRQSTRLSLDVVRLESKKRFQFDWHDDAFIDLLTVRDAKSKKPLMAHGGDLTSAANGSREYQGGNDYVTERLEFVRRSGLVICTSGKVTFADGTSRLLSPDQPLNMAHIFEHRPTGRIFGVTSNRDFALTAPRIQVGKPLALCELTNNAWNVIWNSNQATDLPSEFISDLPHLRMLGFGSNSKNLEFDDPQYIGALQSGNSGFIVFRYDDRQANIDVQYFVRGLPEELERQRTDRFQNFVERRREVGSMSETIMPNGEWKRANIKGRKPSFSEPWHLALSGVSLDLQGVDLALAKDKLIYPELWLTKDDQLLLGYAGQLGSMYLDANAKTEQTVGDAK